jgi:hypothetical protein
MLQTDGPNGYILFCFDIARQGRKSRQFLVFNVRAAVGGEGGNGDSKRLAVNFTTSASAGRDEDGYRVLPSLQL